MMDARSPEETLRQRGGRTETQEAAAEFLGLDAWLARDIPPPDRLLGDLVTSTTRIFLVGRTGLGKTLIAVGLAFGIASGRGFLHWHSHRPGRVLLIDGEMPSELVKARLKAEAQRVGVTIPHGWLTVYARDLEDEFAARFPKIGRMPPLNSEEGRSWLLALIDEIGGVDVVIFDNVMSLISGDQKEEVSWSGTSDLVQALTRRRIGQVWLDHTGHDSSRQYGSSTKAWRFDSVGVMTPLPEDQREEHEVAFTLSFDHPGKARRRTPENWRDFEGRTIRLRDDEWTSEVASKGSRATTRLSPKARDYHDALRDALAVSPTPGKTTRSAWYAECVRRGMADEIRPDEDWKCRDAKRREFRTYLGQIRRAGLIGVDGETVSDLPERGDPQ